MEIAVMNVEQGEEIAASLVGGHIAGTGRYKFLAKRKRNGRYEWAHFTERDNGIKENVYRGEVRTEQELKMIQDIMNRNLKKVFGDHAQMAPGIIEIKPLNGMKSGA
jgi:hypothetical protein